jgi:ParB/RepB/Spo0J family partition protein
MAMLGQLQPASVVSREVYLQRWPDLSGEVKTPWVLMIGNRRNAAAGRLGWDTLECIVREKITRELELLDDIPIHENLHRKGINALRMAYYLAEKKKELGSERAVARHVKKTQPWVNQLLKLLNLIPELQALVKADEITATTGRSLAKLSHDEQQKVWAAVSELDGEARAEFWSSAGWVGDKSFIAAEPESPTVDDPAVVDEATVSDKQVSAQEQQLPADESDSARPRREPPAIMIRIMERSTDELASALRQQLTEDEVENLIRALKQPA